MTALRGIPASSRQLSNFCSVSDALALSRCMNTTSSVATMQSSAWCEGGGHSTDKAHSRGTPARVTQASVVLCATTLDQLNPMGHTVLTGKISSETCKGVASRSSTKLLTKSISKAPASNRSLTLTAGWPNQGVSSSGTFSTSKKVSASLFENHTASCGSKSRSRKEDGFASLGGAGGLAATSDSSAPFQILR